MKIKIGNNEYYTYDLSDIRGKQKSIKFQIEEKVDDISDVIVVSKNEYYFWILEGCELTKPIRKIETFIRRSDLSNLTYYEYNISFNKRYNTNDESIMKRDLRLIKLKELGL